MKIKNSSVIALCIFLVACNFPFMESNNDDATNMVQTGIAATLQALTPEDSSGSPTGTATLEQKITITQETLFTPTPTFTPTTDLTDTLEPGIGSLSGAINNYPYGSIPQLTIVAFEQEPPYHYWYVILGPGSASYTMDKSIYSEFITTGKYQVVAYDPDGHKGGCINIAVVKKDEMVICDITDWLGSYPDKPAEAK